MAQPGSFSSARELLAGLRAGRLSSEQLVAAGLARARELAATVNPLCWLDEGGALARAREADRLRLRVEAIGPLHGLPMTVKDCFEVAGLPAANGAPELRDYRPARHAPAVQRLVDAGAVIFGKSNVPLYSLDLQTFNEVCGVTRNPWNLDRTPGGSSGGAAVALATGITSLEVGSDLAGSVRIPAHATGVCALKTSFGVIPTGGLVHTKPGSLRVPDLLVVGPMARTVDDLAVLLEVLAGPAQREACAWSLRLPPSRAQARDLRVAVWLDDTNCAVDATVGRVLEKACRVLSAAGVELAHEARPPFDAHEYFGDFLRLMYGEMSAGLPDSVYRAFAAAARRDASGGDWTALTLMPHAVTQGHRDWLNIGERRERYRAAWDSFFSDYDVLLAPVAPTTAPEHDHRPFEQRTIRLGGREHAYMQQSFWCGLATLGCLPAAVVPAGRAKDGLPVGLQIIGPYLGEHTVLEFARYAERLLGGFTPPPLSLE